jgi:SAM-dependent methyltransferase
MRLRRRGYWDARAKDLIAAYDQPETWSARKWLRVGAEDDIVPRLLREHGCQTVLVPGAGSGRQYAYLAGFAVTGFDISKRLVRECRRRHPAARTVHGNVIGCQSLGVFDATVSSAVLAHIPATEIAAAVRSIQMATRKLVIVREYTWLRDSHPHQQEHNYVTLFDGWTVVHRDVTDDRTDGRAELIAFAH